MKLSNRLQYIADEIRWGETMADIGTDHGFLPLYLLNICKCPKVIMTDISRGSLKKAEENCLRYDSEREYDLRLGNGIDVLKDGEVDTVVIAGMGGLLIADILDWDMRKSKSMKRYVLQPRNNVGKLRHYLAEKGFSIVKEGLVPEGKFICEILTVEKADWQGETPPYGAEFDYPESLLTFENPYTGEYLRRKLRTEEQIYEKIMAGSSDGTLKSRECAARIKQLRYLIERLEEK